MPLLRSLQKHCCGHSDSNKDVNRTYVASNSSQTHDTQRNHPTLYSAPTRIWPRPLLMRSSSPPVPPKTFFCSSERNPPIPFDLARARSSASSSSFSRSRSWVRCSRRSCVSDVALEDMAASLAARSSAMSVWRVDVDARGGGGLILVRFGGAEGAGSNRSGLRLKLLLRFLLSKSSWCEIGL